MVNRWIFKSQRQNLNWRNICTLEEDAYRKDSKRKKGVIMQKKKEKKKKDERRGKKGSKRQND